MDLTGTSKDFYNLSGTQKISQFYRTSKIKLKCSVLSLCTAVSLVDSVSRDVSNWLFRLFWTLFPEMFPTGYFVSSGDYHDLTGTQKITTILLELKRSKTQMFCALLVHHSLPCRLCLQRCFHWLFLLFWTLFPEMFPLVISSLLEMIVSSPPVLSRGPLKSS